MLGSTGSGMGAAHNMLEQAAEARMQKIKARGAEGFQQHGSGEAGLASRIFGAIGSAIKLSLAGTALFAGYYTYAYRDVGELEDSLKKSRPGGDSKPSGSGGDAAAPSGGLPEPIAGLWASALERYIAVRKAVEQQVKQYTDPTYHKLLPDMAPELRGRWGGAGVQAGRGGPRGATGAALAHACGAWKPLCPESCEVSIVQ